MADDVASLTYELLKRVSARLERVEDELSDVKTRMTSLETGQALIRQELVQQSVQIAALNGRMDRFDERLKRIERRLDLTDA